MKQFPLLLAFFIIISAKAQINPNPKSISAVRIENAPKIDGVLNEDFWLTANIAKDFTMFNPGTGIAEPNGKKTIVKVAYNDEAIFFGAFLYDDDIKNMAFESSTRDNFGQVDWFGIILNPLNDGQNDTEFFIQATGNQGDAKATPDNEDFSWNGVWESAVKLDDEKWVVEVKIPFSELRFSNEEIQTWGVNFHRRYQNSREQYTWNPVDKTKGNLQQYAGELIGLKNITPPIRLSFLPYTSSSYTNYDSDNDFETSFGMDLKYGISESFTLDATLIPDFGQTAFDDVVLNLGPFEQQYSEKRSFFTEGTELFSKGNLFYSRRVGNSPTVSIDEDEDLTENEEILDEPDSVNMLNAVKVSGRNKNGLGIGFFNAITEKTEATIQDTETEEIRKVVTEPFANYNVLIIDKQFNKNSSVSFVNTNVMREGEYRDANVSALLFDLTNKSNKFKIEGGAGYSYINEFDSIARGFVTSVALRKISGNWQYGIEHELQNKYFDKNDLGYQRKNNFSSFESYLSYETFEPTEKFDSYEISFWADVDYSHDPSEYAGNEVGMRYMFFTRKSKLAFGGMLESSIGNQYDYYEPRVDGRYFKESGRIAGNQWISTDYRKKFAFDARIFMFDRLNDDNNFLLLRFSPRYRFNDKLSFNYQIAYRQNQNEKGYVDEEDDGNIIFGKRDTKSYTNSFLATYNFNTKAALNLTFRHYWSPVEYDDQYYSLEEDGTLIEDDYYEDNSFNYNVWNVDLSYSWEFAPGSQLTALYRNYLSISDDYEELNFKENIDGLFEEPFYHNLSLRLIYYIDYNNAKNWL